MAQEPDASDHSTNNRVSVEVSTVNHDKMNSPQRDYVT